MQTPEAVFTERELAGLSAARLLLVDDYYDLLRLPEGEWVRPPGGEEGWMVVPARANLHFRALYGERRRSGGRWLILRKRPEVLMPDVEEQVAQEGDHLRVSPVSLLQQATGAAWPEDVDRCGGLVRDRFGAIVAAYALWQQQPRGPFSTEQATDVLLAGILQVNLFGRTAAAEVWAARFRERSLLEETRQHLPLIGDRLANYLSQRGAPLSWLVEGSPQVAARTLWLMAFLAQREEDLETPVRALYPSSLWLGGLQAWHVRELVETLWKTAPDVVDEQVGWLDMLLAERTAEVMLERLGWSDQVAAQVLVQEACSPFLITLAVRWWLLNWCRQGTLPVPLADWLERSPGRLEGLPGAGQPMRLHRRLAEDLAWLHQEGPRVEGLAGQNAAAGPDQLARLWPAFWTEGGGAELAQSLRRVDALLKEDRLYAAPYQGTGADFPRQVAPWAWQALADRRGGWEAWLKAVERAVLREALEPSERSLLHALDSIWERAAPHASERPCRLFLVGGLDWCLWTALQDRGGPAEGVRAVTVPPPGLPQLILQRWCARRTRTAGGLQGQHPLDWLRQATGLPWQQESSDRMPRGVGEVWRAPGVEIWLWDWTGVLGSQEGLDWLLGDPLPWVPLWQELWGALEACDDCDRWLVGTGGLQWSRKSVPVPAEALVALPSPRLACLREDVQLPTPALFSPADLDLTWLDPIGFGAGPVRAVALAVGEQRWVVEGEGEGEAGWAGGGISPWEAVAPLLALPAARRAEEQAIVWQEPREAAAHPGQLVEYVGWLTLTAGALAEAVEVEVGGGQPERSLVTLYLGEPVRAVFRLTVPTDARPGEYHFFPIHLRWGGRERIVIGRVRVIRATP